MNTKTRFKILLIFIASIALFLCLIYSIPKETLCPQAGPDQPPGVYGCVTYSSKYMSFIRRPGHYLELVNNTDYPIVPAQDGLMGEWLLLRKTELGWQKFDALASTEAIPLTPNIDRPLASYQTGTYRLESLNLGRYGYDTVTSMPKAGLQFSFAMTPLVAGEYKLQIAYRQLQPTKTVTLTTYTNLIPYLSPKPTSMLVSVTPVVDNEQHHQIKFIVSNDSDDDIWLKPLSWVSRDNFYPKGWMILTKQVDHNSWKDLHWEGSITKHSTEPVQISANSSIEVTATDLDTEIILSDPGIYRWIIPIYLEYYPNPNPPRLNRTRYLFSETLEIE